MAGADGRGAGLGERDAAQGGRGGQDRRGRQEGRARRDEQVAAAVRVQCHIQNILTTSGVRSIKVSNGGLIMYMEDVDQGIGPRIKGL